MKQLLAIIILSLCFITPSQADDVRDFEIEGISLGDSALKYFSQENLETNISNPPNLKNSLYDQSCFDNYGDTYDRICITYKKNSKKKIINSIQAQIIYNRAAIPTCKKKQKEIDKEFSLIFKNLKRREWDKQMLEGISHIDPEAHYYPIIYEFSDKSRSQVGCYHIKNLTRLKVAIYTHEFGLVIRN